MGKIVVTEYISVDGVIEAPGGGEDFEHAGWTFSIERGEDGDRIKFDELLEAEVQLFGRTTYEGFAAAWPAMEDEPGFADLAKLINSMPKYVYSKTLKDPSWNGTTVLSGDLAEDVRKLKDEVDGVILVAGSAALVQALIDVDLVDELRLMVFPVVLGSGKRLFGPSGKKSLRLTDARTVGDGIQILTYQRA
ncbi:MAG TPA: dihydrofolate reductase family protein [Conexibacter sp.]